MTFFGSVITVASTLQARNTSLRGYVDPLSTTSLPFRIPLLGVNADLRQYSGQELQTQLDLMQNAGITWVRQFFYWNEIERETSVYDWRPYDEIIEAFRTQESLQIVAVFMNSPEWSRGENTSPTAPPDNTSDFAAFIAAASQRYGDVIDHYQIWDEPNLSAAWGNSEPNPSLYAALLAEAYQAVHANDSHATVILAALAPTTENNLLNISDIAYLDSLYQVGAGTYFDAAAGKPYGFSSDPHDPVIDVTRLNFSRFILLREVMERHGDQRKALWGSAWGWNYLPESWNDDPSLWGEVEQQEQIEYTLAALDRADNQWAWVGGMVLQHWQPAAPATDPVWGFSLRTPTGESTPLFDAIANRPNRSVARHGLHPAASPFATYSGVWTFGELGADIGWVNDSRLEFSFEGRGVGLLLRQGNFVAFMYPRIDEQNPDRLPLDGAGNAYINLQSDDLSPNLDVEVIGTALSSGPHRLTVIADRGWDQWALAGYAVSSGNPVESLDHQLIIAAITTFTSMAAVAISALHFTWRPVNHRLQQLWLRLGDAGQVILSVITSIALMGGLLLTWGDPVPNMFRRDPAQLGLAILTAGLIYISPSLILSISAAILLFIIFYHRPDLGITLTLLFAPFFLFPVELWRFAFPMSEVMILLTSTAWIMRKLVIFGRQRQALPRSINYPTWPATVNSLDLAVTAFAVLGIVSLLWTSESGPALTEIRTLIIEPILFYAIARTFSMEQRTRLRLVDTLIVSGVLVSVIGLVLYASGSAIITAEDGARRLASVYGSPNNVGLWLGRCLPFAAAFLLIRSDRRRTIMSGAALAIMLATVLLTQSAGAIFLGIPAGLAATILFAYGRRGLIPITAIAAGVAAIFAFAVQTERFARLLSLSEGTNFFRIRVWQSALNVLRDYPLTGLGMDQFLYRFRGRYILPDAWQEPNLSHPHNILLDFWIRLGVIGVAVLAWTQFLFWNFAVTVYRQTRSGRAIEHAMIVGTMASMAALLTHGLIDNSVFVQDLIYVYMFLLVLANSRANTRAIDGDRETVM